MKRILKRIAWVGLLAAVLFLAPAFLAGRAGSDMGVAYAGVMVTGEAGPMTDGEVAHSGTGVPAAGYGIPLQGPITMPSNPSEVPAGFAMGQSAILTYFSVQTPAAVNANTCVEQALTVTGVLAGSVVFVSKPTTQVGLAVLTARVSAANTIQLTYANPTAGNITPTAGQTYLIVEIRGPLIQSAALTPAAVASLTTAEQVFTLTPAIAQQGVSSAQHGLTSGVLTLAPAIAATSSLAAGAVPGVANQAPVLIGTPQTVLLNKPTSQAGLGVANVRVVGNNQIGITYVNTSGAPITPTAETYTFVAARGFSLHGVVVYSVNVGTLAAVAQGTTAEQTLTVNGLAVTDQLLGYPTKPTTQAGLGIVGARITAANTLGITFANVPNAGGNITPTGSEIYTIAVLKGGAAAGSKPVLQQFTAVFTPASVAAITGAEQIFPVPNAQGNQLASASPIAGFNVAATVGAPANTFGTGWSAVSPGGVAQAGASLGAKLPAGLIVGGVRVSSAGNIAINFLNVTATAIVPPQLMITFLAAPTDTGSTGDGSSMNWGYDAQDQQAQEMAWALQAALVAQNWMQGS